MKKNKHIFCSSKKIQGILENEKFIQCANCLRDYCETCSNICHKICPQICNDPRNFLVVEYGSSCHCTHYIKTEKKESSRVECSFYSKFFYKIFNLQKEKLFYKLKNEGIIICLLCKLVHSQKLKNEILEGFENEQVICECNHISHKSFNLSDLCDFMRSCFELNSFEINYSYLVTELKNS